MDLAEGVWTRSAGRSLGTTPDGGDSEHWMELTPDGLEVR